ncbi:MAG: DUF4271 domain-containing protein [Bacteroidetes bacterium]|nr:DUF4271 domain-containing protein [Bacteroidota bacterium]
MAHTFYLSFCLLAIFLLFSARYQPLEARAFPQSWGLVFNQTDSTDLRFATRAYMDSLLKLSPGRSVFYYKLEPVRPYKNAAPSFYLLCALCLMLGIIRYTEPRYFSLLLGSFRNAGTGQKWQEMLQASWWPNFWMNVFFASVMGAYIFYLFAGVENSLKLASDYVLLPLLIAAMLIIYLGKFLILSFSGWAFRMKTVAGQYIFNVFLVNKIIGIVLLPFVVLIAFSGPEWREPLGIVSGVLVLGLLGTRYLRSWPAFQQLFKGSKFHFLTYLCASEILPMAVLVKWLLLLLR